MTIERPQIAAIFAMSADGKISDARRSGRKFGSRADFRHLEACVARADGVLMGAGTLRSGGTAMRVLSDELFRQRADRGLPPQPIQAIVSRTGNLSRSLKFFAQPIPRWLVTTTAGARRWTDDPAFDRVWVCERPPAIAGEPSTVDLAATLRQLRSAGIARLAVLGGGALVADLFAIDAIDELHLTVCPLVLGGAGAPTPVDGAGFRNAEAGQIGAAPSLELLGVRPIADEVFLHYRVRRRSPG